MNDLAWPPSGDLLNWRPSATSPKDWIWRSSVARADESLPDWVAVPTDAEPNEDGDISIPAYELAHVETDAGRPGGGGLSSIYAVATVDGDFQIVITNDDEIPFTSPIDRLAKLPSLGELLNILDQTEV